MATLRESMKTILPEFTFARYRTQYTTAITVDLEVFNVCNVPILWHTRQPLKFFNLPVIN